MFAKNAVRSIQQIFACENSKFVSETCTGKQQQLPGIANDDNKTTYKNMNSF